MELREQFEKLHPVPEGVSWSDGLGMYACEFLAYQNAEKRQNGLWQGFQSGYAAAMSHSANTVGGPTPGAAPACASERSVSESIAAGHPCFDPDGPPDHDWKYVDDSFSHEFGTEICGHYECARCNAIKPE